MSTLRLLEESAADWQAEIDTLYPRKAPHPHGPVGVWRGSLLRVAQRQLRDRQTAQRAIWGVRLYGPMYVTPSRLGRLEGYAFYVGYERSKQK